jgi:hypothetical protein
MSDYLRYILVGASGREWDLTRSSREGVELRPGAQQFIDAPASTFWIKSIYGQSYQGSQWKRREPTFAVTIAGKTADRWEQIDSDFREDLGIGIPGAQTFTLRAETGAACRTLCMRLLEHPEAYTKGDWEGKDPHLFRKSTLAIPAACERGFWTGKSLVSSVTFPTGNGTLPIWVANYGDVPIWLFWSLPAPGTWTVPDYSWGQEEDFGYVAGEWATRTLTLSPLTSGEDLEIETNPDGKGMIAANGDPVQQRNGGIQFIFPVAPHTPPTQIPLELVGGNAGTTAYVTCPAWFSRPWGVSL